jgi:hypothetical protein
MCSVPPGFVLNEPADQHCNYVYKLIGTHQEPGAYEVRTTTRVIESYFFNDRLFFPEYRFGFPKKTHTIGKRR